MLSCATAAWSMFAGSGARPIEASKACPRELSRKPSYALSSVASFGFGYLAYVRSHDG